MRKIITKVFRKMSKLDVAVLVVWTVIMAMLTYHTFQADYHDLREAGSVLKVADAVVAFPVMLVGVILALIFRLTGEDSEGLGFLLIFIAPAVAFIFWFAVFYLLTRLSDNFLKDRK